MQALSLQPKAQVSVFQVPSRQDLSSLFSVHEGVSLDSHSFTLGVQNFVQFGSLQSATPLRSLSTPSWQSSYVDSIVLKDECDADESSQADMAQQARSEIMEKYRFFFM